MLIHRLTKYGWPGNIRELQHSIERAVILCASPALTIQNFQLQSSLFGEDQDVKSLNLSEVEREVIRQALRKSNGNLTRAAEELGIGRTTLYRKMEEYGIVI